MFPFDNVNHVDGDSESFRADLDVLGGAQYGFACDDVLGGAQYGFACDDAVETLRTYEKYRS